MGSVRDISDDEYSSIAGEGNIGFIDIDNCKSVCNYIPSEESQLVNISIPFPLVNGKPQSGFVGENIFDTVTIKNITSEALTLWSVTIYDSKPLNSFTISLTEPPTAKSDAESIENFIESDSLEERVIKTDRDLKFWLLCKSEEIGLHSAAIHFNLGEQTIERLVFVLAEDKISRSLSTTRPYNQRSRRKKQSLVNVNSQDAAYVVGQRPSKGSTSGRGYRNRLDNYPIPGLIREMISNNTVPEVVDQGLTRSNYGQFFKTLVAMEEIKLEEDMSAYGMESVAFKRKNIFLTLEVPGLAEKRPSLVNGDFIFAKLATEDQSANTAYQGYIHRVEAEEIHLKFDQAFHNTHRERNLYNVQFNYNRLGMRRLYQAIETAQCLNKDFLFPSSPPTRWPAVSTPMVPISCTLNGEQITAIEMILARKGGSPYLIHGPPGTGKTMTLIEAILQIYRSKKNARILVCAPSNSAADHILDRLLREEKVQIKKDHIFRLNALTRPFEDVSPDHIDYCFFEDSIFKCPTRWDLVKYRIIISTYTSASLLYAEGVRRGHFSYIFLDEAGQASEPETMVALSNLYSENSNIILAGDPKQLGPVVFSRDAEQYGLGTSYLERLFACTLYESEDQNFMTRLVCNYRTHEAILYLPSMLFYDGELKPCKEDDTDFTESLGDLLPNKEFPLLFIGIQGCDEREGNNPSWFNRIEASKVVEIIRVLIEQKGLVEGDIGVITPYRQQVSKIRGALESLNWADIKVGSVEQFQGQEKKVIIISTVRSTIKHNEFDKTHYLGFLSNPRRFNVAITRARSLLVVIGNPHILCKDQNWSDLLWYCVEQGSYKGCFLPEKEDFSAGGPTEGQHNRENDYKPPEGDWGDGLATSEPQRGQYNGENDYKPPEGDWGDGWATNEPQREQYNGGNDYKPPEGDWGDGWATNEPQQNTEEPSKESYDVGNNNWKLDTEGYNCPTSEVEWGLDEPSNESYDVGNNNRKVDKEGHYRPTSEVEWPLDEHCDMENGLKTTKWNTDEYQYDWDTSEVERGLDEHDDWKPSDVEWGQDQPSNQTSGAPGDEAKNKIPATGWE